MDASDVCRFNACMHRSPAVVVQVDLGRVRKNVAEVRRKTNADLLAVVKADAYGLGASAVAGAIGDLVDGFCVFDLREAVQADLWGRTGKPVLVLGPPATRDPAEYFRQHARPAVTSVEQANALRAAGPVLCVDTGMQRFTWPASQLKQALESVQWSEAFTHAVQPEQAHLLLNLISQRNLYLHAAASALLDDPSTHLNAVRPGLALYRGAVRVSTPLVEVHDTHGPAGYTGFEVERHGVILAGYSNGVRTGPCLINGHLRRIIEVGMQSAFVEIGPKDRVGDEVTMLGDGLSESAVAAEWRSSAQEVILRLSGSGKSVYI